MQTTAEEYTMDAVSADTPKHGRMTAARSAVSGNPVLPVIAGIGFAVSFQTIMHEAALHHLPGYSWLYPVLIDAGILGFVVEARKAIADGRSDLVPRFLAWLLAGFTLYVNAHGSPSRDWLGITLHVAAPVMWIAFLELTRWRQVRKIRMERGDSIPLRRWLVAFRQTLGMRKRMIIHYVTSYAEATAREEARLLGMDLAAAVYGKRWRKDAPALLVHHLLQGTLPGNVARACADRSPDVPDLVEKWVTGAREARERAARKALPEASREGTTVAVATAPRKAAGNGRGSRARWPLAKDVQPAVLTARIRNVVEAWAADHDGERMPATRLAEAVEVRMSRDTATMHLNDYYGISATAARQASR